MKRKITIPILILALISLSGCSLLSYVNRLSNWSFQENQGTNDYSLFFCLEDNRDQLVSAKCVADITIINDNNETVYSGKKEVNESDWGNYSNVISGSKYMANVRIKKDELKPGTSSSGTVYFTIEGEDFSFDTANCPVNYCLPLKEITLEIPQLPIDLYHYDFNGKADGKYTITNVTFSYDLSSYSNYMEFTVYGQKLEGSSEIYASDSINYKLYDSAGYVVDSGTIYFDRGVDVGDKFKATSYGTYGIVPGENYSLVLTDYTWN